MIVAVGAVMGGQTGMAAVTGRRKQLVKSQQLQPVAAAVNTTTADRTNSFLMIDFLRKTDRGEYGGSEWIGRLDRAGYASKRAQLHNPRDRAIRRFKRWAEQLYITIFVVQTQRVVFLNKGVARARRKVSKNRTGAGRWVRKTPAG